MYKHLKSTALATLAVILLFNQSHASLEDAQETPETPTFLGTLINQWNPQKATGAYAFSFEYTFAISQRESHTYHVLSAINLPDFWTVKNVWNKHFVTVYPDVEKIFLRVLETNNTLVLWDYTYQELEVEFLWKFLKMAWLPFSSPELINGHIQSLLDKGALVFKSRRDVPFDDKMPLRVLAPQKDGLMISGWTRCIVREDFPYITLRPEIEQMISRLNSNSSSPFAMHFSPEETLRHTQSEVARMMGMIEAIESQDPSIPKRHKLRSLLETDGFSGNWTPQKWNTDKPGNPQPPMHPRAPEWIALGQEGLAKISQRATGSKIPIKPYGDPVYYESQAIKRIKKSLYANEDINFSAQWDLAYHLQPFPLTSSQIIDLLTMLKEKPPIQIQSLVFDSVNPFDIDPDFDHFLSALPMLKKLRFIRIHLKDQHAEKLWAFKFATDALEKLDFDEKTVTFESDMQENLRKVHKHTLTDRGEKRLQNWCLEEHHIPFLKGILDALQSEDTLEKLELISAQVDYDKIQNLIAPLKLKYLKLDFNFEHKPQEFLSLVGILESQKETLQSVNIDVKEFSASDLEGVLRTLNTMPQLKRVNLTVQSKDFARKAILDFFATNTQVTEFYPTCFDNRIFEDTMFWILRYNKAWQKLLPHLDQAIETISSKLIGEFAETHLRLPNWQTKKALNLEFIHNRNRNLFMRIESINQGQEIPYPARDQGKNPFSDEKH